MKKLAYCLSIILLISAIPSVLGGGDGVHWNGYRLDRGSISNHMLTDQNGELYSLQEGNADVNIVAFIFTSCVDVCPVITNNLVIAEKQLEGIDYQFISITVDPNTDTPQVLKDYSEDFEANWPHLTGNHSELSTVWDDFQISVLEEEIETHDHSHNHENMSHEMIVLYPDNSTSMLKVGMDSLPMNNATGWNLTTAATGGNNISLNYSTHEEYGNSVTGINGYDSPEDWSWYWNLHLWSDENMSWEVSNVGIDSVMIMNDTNHIAWVASNANQSKIPMPMSVHSDEAHENETSISHSTQTFILDDDWKPIVVYTGINWKIDNFVEDINRALSLADEPNSKDSRLPGFTFGIVIMSLSLAIIAERRLD